MKSSSSRVHEVMKCIWKKEGIRGFYRGCQFNFIISPLFYGVYFYIYGYSKKFNKEGKLHLTFLSGVTCSSIASLYVNPFYVIKTRRQNNLVYTSNIDFLSIIKREGIKALYKGYVWTLLKNIEMGVQMSIYETLKDRTYVPLAAFTSKIIAATLTYPIETIRTRVRTYIHKPTLKQLIKEGNLFKGYSISMISSVSKSVITFSVYDFLKWLINEG